MQTIQFWSLATLMVLAATTMLVVPLYWREARLPDGTAWRRWEPLAIAAAVPFAALCFYQFTGSPALVGATPAGAASFDAHASAARMGNRQGGDLDAAIARLRARLAEDPGDAAGWRLLAQSYEFQGRAAEAAEASARAETLIAGTSAAAPPARTAAAADERETQTLVSRAQEARRRRDFAAAVDAFAALEGRGALSADLWADYADALGGARGGLDDEAGRCIDAALRLDPRHVKALWLRASLQTRRRDFAAAAGTWQELAKLLPPDSPDARIIAANLAEARASLAGAGAGSSAAPEGRGATAALRGDVRLDPRWRARVAAGSVLFVYARAADERGPPLAVWRTTAGAWPVRFELDDADAMMPGRRLSDFRRVVLEARISRTGNAIAQPGDLRAVSGVLDPHSAPAQQLVIAEEVGPAATAQGG